MSILAATVKSPNHSVNEAMRLIKWEGSREESVLRQNREGVELLKKAHMERDADASYYLGVVRLNDLDGTGQDLFDAAECFRCAHQRGHVQGLKGMEIAQAMLSEKANVFLSQGFLAEARSLHQNAVTVFDTIMQTKTMDITSLQPKGKSDFPLPKKIIMP